jgi:phosphohistidine phosphatase
MKLYLLRHGLAVELGTHGMTQDSQRPLTPKGERKLEQITEAMEALGLWFDLILSSPYLRTRQTAELIAEALGARKRLKCTEALAPAGSMKELVSQLQAADPAPERVLLVGHEPYLSEFTSLLLSGDTGLAITFRKGGLCKLVAASLKHGRCASLEWLLTPKQMARMSSR